jgi:hypothetical protein
MDLWKQPCLNLLRNFQLLRGTAFAFELLGKRAALRFNALRQFIEAG